MSTDKQVIDEQTGDVSSEFIPLETGNDVVAVEAPKLKLKEPLFDRILTTWRTIRNHFGRTKLYAVYIEVGNLPQKDIEEYVNKVCGPDYVDIKLVQKMYNICFMVFPVRNGYGSSIEALDSTGRDSSLDGLSDSLESFASEMSTGLDEIGASINHLSELFSPKVTIAPIEPAKAKTRKKKS